MEFRKGDILIFHDNSAIAAMQGAVVGAKAVAQGLSLSLGHANGASTMNAVHGAIVHDADGKRIAHSVNAGLTKDNIAQMSYPNYSQYRLAYLNHVSNDAAAVARDWAMAHPNRPNRIRNAKYSASKAFGSVFGSAKYGKQAKRRADTYAASVRRDGGGAVEARFGGPQSTGRGASEDSFKGFYCSMFVVACYQAIMSETQRLSYMALDAKYTSPMILEQYLQDSPSWICVTSNGTGI
ncbi:MAG: hypothetical protein AAFX85_00655 [Pseudomonadota bacterium]